MSLEVSGKVVKLLPEQSGESSRGPWKKQDLIIETDDQFPKKLAITCWGEKVDEIQKLSEGTKLKVSVNLESREFNERWYTDVKAWKIEVLGQGQDSSSSASFPRFEETDAPVLNTDETDGDLPF